jgi:type II secretory ATPase GspE/PulE/Tfp pilus assembly ATPase PilB-like protein
MTDKSKSINITQAFKRDQSTIDEIIQNKSNPEASKVIAMIRKKQRSGEMPAMLRLGDILSISGLVTEDSLQTLLEAKTDANKKMGEVLVDSGLLTEDQIFAALAIKCGMKFVDLENYSPTNETLELIPASLAKEMQVIPLAKKNNTLVIAISSPSDQALLEDNLRFSLRCRIMPVLAKPQQIESAIKKYYTKNSNVQTKVDSDALREKQKLADNEIQKIINEMAKEDLEAEGPTPVIEEEISASLVIRLVNQLLLKAYDQNASDIHFEPKSDGPITMVRYRIDGICHDVHTISSLYEKAVIARIKILAGLNIAEKRMPQSGKITLFRKDQKIEYRVEVTPTVNGLEDAVLRTLASSEPIKLKDLGFTKSNLERFSEAIHKPYGIILCVGPTGSGKTTTLHSALGHINTPERKIWTAEDPVEITQKRLRQVQVHPEIGLTFQVALRSFLRADPDVIMIGEMRDIETTKTAIDASLTGHLVFSTLHTNSAPETIVRLIEMGVEPYNFADACLAILAQRLCRKLCPICSQTYTPEEDEYTNMIKSYGLKLFAQDKLQANDKHVKLVKPGKCSNCNNVGYKGRIAIQELLVASDEIRTAIKEHASTSEIRKCAIEEGMRTLRMDGIQKSIQGVTSYKEIMRTTG